MKEGKRRLGRAGDTFWKMREPGAARAGKREVHHGAQ